MMKNRRFAISQEDLDAIERLAVELETLTPEEKKVRNAPQIAEIVRRLRDA